MRHILALSACALLIGCSQPEAETARMEIDPDAAWQTHLAIEARTGVMDEMQVQMLEIDKAALDVPFDIRSGRVRAGAIAAMLGATSFLFPEGSDSESTANLPTPSRALPAIWEDPDAFAAMIDDAAHAASDLVEISDEAAFRRKAAQLRNACNACHAAYQEGYAAAP